MVQETSRRAGWPLSAAALAAAMYAGFRFNECLGTDLVLSREPASTALSFIQVLNSKRNPAVLTLVALSLASGIAAVALARQRRLALIGLGLLLVEVLLTAVFHIPLAMRLQTMVPAAPPPDWDALKARYIFDDLARTGVLLGASVVFAAAGLRSQKTGEYA
jgi:hypothetical protein